MENTIKKIKLLYTSFNSDSSLFSIGTEEGYAIFRTNPFDLIIKRNLEGGIGIIEILNRSNILVLVGGGERPKFPNNKLVIWDDLENKSLSEIKFSYEIINIKLNEFHLFTVCENFLHIFNMNDLQLIESVETYDNIKGVFALSMINNKSTIISYPDPQIGYIAIKEYSIKENINCFDKIFWAHTCPIGYIIFNINGKLVCTASENGTIIRIFNSNTGEIGYEFRRGIDKTQIFSLSFDMNSNFICCSSNKGTIHIFSLDLDSDINNENNKMIDSISFQKTNTHQGFFGAIYRYLQMPSGVLTSKKSFALYRMTDDLDFDSICSFNYEMNDGKIFIITKTGKFFCIEFDRINGGETKDATIYNFLNKLK